VVGAAQPIAPCTHAEVDTTGWRPERFDERLVFRLPPTFKRDRTAKYIEGGRRWTDDDRTLELALGGYWGETSFGKLEPETEGYSECIDTLAATRFRLITWRGYKGRYYAVAIPDSAYHPRGAPLKRAGHLLSGSCRTRADQRLVLAVFRTLHADSITPWGK
jgi:hypothetical protein